MDFLYIKNKPLHFYKKYVVLGSEADNIRRAIGKKTKGDKIDKALPQILEGYCNKSDKPREIAEQEAKQIYSSN